MLAYAYNIVRYNVERRKEKHDKSCECCICSHKQFMLYHTVFSAITDVVLFLHVCLLVSEFVLAYAG
jgi:hypothetical protein